MRAWTRFSYVRAALSLLVSVAMLAVVQPGGLARPAVAVAAPAVLTSLSAPAGAPGSTVVLTGTGFGATQGTNKVTFGGYKATITSWSDTSITCTVPASAIPGYVGVWVSGVVSNGIYFVPVAPPVLSGLTPQAGPTGSVVTLSGTDFGPTQGTSSVTFAGTPATVNSWSDTSITVSVPVGAAAGYVGVWKSGVCSNGRYFAPGAVPGITALSASTGSIGTTVTVTGTGFGASPGQLTLSGTVVPTTAWSDTSVSFVVPATAVAGYVGVWQGSNCSNGYWFTPAPRLDSLSKWWGPAGTSVTLAGAGFGATQGSSKVTFAGTDATITAWSDTSITLSVPGGAAAGYVGVWKDGACSNGIWFLPMSAPSITDVDPIEAPVGAVVTITGAGFGTATDTVTFAGVSAPVLSWSDTTITAQVPVGATSGVIGVWRSGVASNGWSFGVSAAAPVAMGTERYTSLASGVNVANGNLVLTGMSVSIPGDGEGTKISSTYNSLDTAAGSAGPGWTFSFEQRLISYPNSGEAWLQPDGSIHVFGRMADGSYVSAQGEYATLVKGGDGSFTLTDRDKIVYRFGSDRLLRSITDRNGNATTLSYDSAHRPTTMTDASGRVSHFAYDADGLLVTVTDCAGRVTDFEYDASGRLVLMTLPTVMVGPTPTRYSISYDYDASGRLVTVTDARGKATGYTYDGGSARVASITDPEGAATSFAYNSAAGTSTVTQAGGERTGYTASAAGLVVRSSTPVGLSILQSYDTQLNMVAGTDSSGASFSNAYDAEGRMTSSTDPAGRTTLISYTPTATASEPSTLTAPDGKVTSSVYDGSGDKLSETDPAGATTTYSYTDEGHVASVTDPTGRTTSMSWDATGNMVGITEPGGAATTLSYNSLGLVASTKDAAGYSGLFSYDSLGRMTQVSEPSGSTQSYAYDENGNRISTTDAKGDKVLSVYDDANRLTEVTPDPVVRTYETTGSAASVNVGTVGYTYDTAGRIKTRTDQDGNTTTLAYDPVTGQLVSETDAAGKVTTYGYDTLGNMTSTLFADGTTSSFTYNTVGQVTQQTVAGRTTNYAYDAAGRMTGETLVGGVSVARSLDAAGRVTLDAVGSNSTGYTYDAAGRVTGIAPSGLPSRALTYDVAGRLSTVTAGGAWEAAGYDLAGRVTTLSASSGERSYFAYDAAGHLASVRDLASGGTTLSAFAYTYDANGSIASVTDRAGAKKSYFYDNLNEIINVRDGAGSLLYHYDYDAAGNRTKAYRSGVGTTTYSYDASDTTRLLSASGPEGAASWAYDAQGRVASKVTTAGTTTLSWAADGYLKSATLPGGKRVTYDYDASWRRVSRSVYSAGATTTVVYHYDGDRLVAEKTEGGSVIAAYTYGADGRLATMSRGGQTYRYQLDSIGSVVSLSDASGTIVNSYSYDPFGRIVAKTEGVQNPFTFAGYWQDADTGLYHLKARWYEPETGRFLSKDAVKDVAGDPLSANHYLYCKNDPVNKVDPEGTWPSYVHWGWIGWHAAIGVAGIVTSLYGWGWIKLARLGARGREIMDQLRGALEVLDWIRRGRDVASWRLDGLVRFGLSFLFGLVPGLGDGISAWKHFIWATRPWMNNPRWQPWGHANLYWWWAYV